MKGSIKEMLDGTVDELRGMPDMGVITFPPQPEPLPRDEQIKRLDAFLDRYTNLRNLEVEFPFTEGDYVVCRKDGLMRGDDGIYLIVEIDLEAVPDFGSGHPSEPIYGRYPELRLARMTGEQIQMFWGEATDFELYDPNKKEEK